MVRHFCALKRGVISRHIRPMAAVGLSVMLAASLVPCGAFAEEEESVPDTGAATLRSEVSSGENRVSVAQEAVTPAAEYERNLSVPSAVTTALSDGTPVQDEKGVYQLRTVDEVLWFFSTAPASASAVLCGDFDLRGTTFAPKTGTYTGTFDGAGHTLTVEVTLPSNDKRGGLFAANSGTVCNVNLAGTVTTKGYSYGSSYSQGGMVGENTGTIQGCTNYATVGGSANKIGGIVAYNAGLVESCLNAGAVSTTASSGSGSGYAGGIVGLSGSNTKKGTCIDCINVGSISANRGAGGIVGYAYTTSGNTVLTRCQTTKTLSPAKTQTIVDSWLNGDTSTFTMKLTDCSFYQVPVVSLTLEGAAETGVTLQARALGETGMEASGTVFTWESASSAEGPFTPIASAGTSAMFAISENETLVGSYIRATVIADGDSSAVSNVVGPIEKSDRLLVTEARDALTVATDDITEENLAAVNPLHLPTAGLNNATIGWTSDHPDIIAPDGGLALPETAEAVAVKLTATVTIGSASATKNFTVKVHPAENPVATVTVTAQMGDFAEGPLETGTKLTASALGLNGKAATGVTYQWQYAESLEAAAAGAWENITGATAASYSIANSYNAANPEAWNGWVVRVVVKGAQESTALSQASTPVEFSDKLAVETDFYLLQKHYGSANMHIYEPCDLAFPTEGSHGTTITWTSKNENLISSTGVVTLPEVNTTIVYISGVVNEGNTSPRTYSNNVSVHPTPVALTGVSIEGVAESGQTLTAVPSSTGLATPTDVTYQWEYSSNGTKWSQVSSYLGGTSATWNTTSSTYGGKYVRVTATGVDELGQSVSYSSEPMLYTYLSGNEPTRIEISGECAYGQTLTASASYGGSTYYQSLNSAQVAWQWYVSTTGESDSYLPIPGATSAIFTPSISYHEMYLQVSARTQKGTYRHSLGQVGPLDLTPEETQVKSAVLALQDAEANGWALSPTSPTDSNIVKPVEKKLAAAMTASDAAANDISVRLVSAEPLRNGAFANISCADDETNGTISYFFYNPRVDTPSLTQPDGYGAAFALTFEITCGDAKAQWSPTAPVSLGWDQTRIQKEILEPCAQAAGATMFAPGDSAQAVTRNLVLPTNSGAIDGVLADPAAATAIFSPFVTATWATNGFDNYYVGDDGVINDRPANDRAMSITGTFTFCDGFTPPTKATLTRSYNFTLKEEGWDPTLTDQEILQRKIDARYQLWNSTRTEALTTAGETTLIATDDFVLPTSTQLGLPGFGISDKYTFTAESSNEAVLSINAYRVNVFQPLGEGEAQATLTVKVFERERPWVVAKLTYDVTVPAVTREEIEAEIALMDEARAGYFEAIANGQSADAVTDDLAYFFKVSRAADGSLLWSRTHADAQAITGGIVVQLVTDSAVPDDNQYFESSDKRVVTHQNLLVTRPDYDRVITVRSCFSSEKFADYYERYREDATWGPLLAQLYRQPVEATFTVKGTLGSQNPAPSDDKDVLTVNASIVGVTDHAMGDSFQAQTWVPSAALTMPADESWTAWDCFSRLLSACGMTASTEEGWCPYSITNQAGRTLATVSGSRPSYWAFYVNGMYADEYPDDYTVCAGDVLELRYLDYTGVEYPVDTPETNPEATHPAIEPAWQGFAEEASALAQGHLRSAAEVTPRVGEELEEAFEPLLLTSDRESSEQAQAQSRDTDSSTMAISTFAARGFSARPLADRARSVAYSSDPVVIGDQSYIVTGSSGSLATLSVVKSDGSRRAAKTLAGAIDSTCRVAVGEGIVVVPLAEGAVQALSATTLETLWYVPASLEGAQSLSTPTVGNGLVYVATAEALDRSGKATRGTLRAFDMASGQLRGAIVNNDAGFYWAGGAIVSGAFVIGDDAGIVHAYRPDLSLEVSRLALSSSPLRSTLVVGTASGSARSCYLVSRDGTLHRFAVDSAGQLRLGSSVKFADTSTSTPAVLGNRAYVGGQQGSSGLLAVINLESLSVVSSITSAEGEPLPGEVKSHPLMLSDTAGQTLYFTCNDATGALYGYKIGTAEAQRVYRPTTLRANYTMASPFMDASGRIGYTNDSGYLFMLQRVITQQPVTPSTDKPNGAGTLSPNSAVSGTTTPTQNGGTASTVKPSSGQEPLNTQPNPETADQQMKSSSKSAAGDASTKGKLAAAWATVFSVAQKVGAAEAQNSATEETGASAESGALSGFEAVAFDDTATPSILRQGTEVIADNETALTSGVSEAGPATNAITLALFAALLLAVGGQRAFRRLQPALVQISEASKKE